VLTSAYRALQLQGSAVLAKAINIGEPVSQRRLIQAILQVMRAKHT
jgi:hypothetical protein